MHYLQRFIVTLTIICSFYTISSAQSGPCTIKGTVEDTVSYTTMQYASISVIRQADSMLQSFTRADENGNFSLQVPDTGKYIILVAHPMFADYHDVINVNETTTDIGKIQLTSKEHLLQEVIIDDSRAITIKGDTTEYAADSFKVRQFATVDELLKKLPGIEVDKNGNITAYGEKVQKMYVDGEEFFADDPAMVAKMLRASAVDKVQVYDKKSDEAEFTGIDDGEKIKTINLKLKENAKQGYFGKVSAGGGTDQYWENQGMLNAFKGKRKMSVYGTMSNTSTTGLSWDQNNQYGSGGGSAFSIDDDGVFSSNVTSDDFSSWDGQYHGQGLPKSWNAGAHYNNKWWDDALSFNGNYQFGKFNINTVNNTRTQYILPDTQYVNNNYQQSFNTRQQNKASFIAEYKIDSSQSLKLNVSGYLRSSESYNKNSGNAVSMNGDLINSSEQDQTTKNDGSDINGNLLYRKKFKKEGRTLSVNLTGLHDETSGKGDYYSLNTFYTPLGNYDSTINQYKDSKSETNQFTGKVTYTEKLSKIIALELNYALNINNNTSSNYSYDKLSNGETDNNYNPLYSGDYAYNILTNSGGASLRFKFNDRYNLTIGGTVSNSGFKQHDNIVDSSISYSYFNFFPRVIFGYNKSRQSHFRFTYQGSTQQPTISQIQPLRENSDPLNILIGNPDLKQAFNHNFNLNYGTYKVLSQRYIWANLGANVIQDAITQSQTISDGARRTYQYINMNGNYNLYGYVGYGFKIKPVNMNMNISANGNYSHNNTMLNGLKSTSINQSYGPGISLNYDKDTTFSISYGINISYNRSNTTINPDIINDYWSLNQDLNARYTFPQYFEIGTTVSWLARQKIDAQDKNNSVFRWDAYVSKSFLKDHSLVLKLSANDILNQNIGFLRNAYDNYISESSYNTIQRYFMLSLAWNFTHSAALSGGHDESEGSEAPTPPPDK